jgi:argininosuccinate synthase
MVKAFVLFSGGLDSTLAAYLAKQMIDAEFELVYFDLGQRSVDLDKAVKRADRLRMPLKVIRGEGDFVREFIEPCIRMRGDYFGYPLGTPLSRAFMFSRMMELIGDNSSGEAGALPWLVHGCARYQNTRVRFQKMCYSSMAFRELGPLTTHNWSRKDKVDALSGFGFDMTSVDEYAEDETLWCRAVEGDSLHNFRSMYDPDPFQICADPFTVSQSSEELEISFDGGVPYALNGEHKNLCEILRELNALGASHGLGRIDVFEDTVPELGYKQRGVFEFPGGSIIYCASEFIESGSLDMTSRAIIRTLSAEWSKCVYRGDWFGSDQRELFSRATALNHRVSGRVRLRVGRGHCRVIAADIDSMLVDRSGNDGGKY